MEFDLAPYIARLAEQLNGWGQIGGAADLAAIEDSAVTPPAVFLVLLSDQPASNPFAGEFVQHVVVRFGAVLVIENLIDHTGTAAGSELTVRRGEVRAALAGWSPHADLGYAQRGAGALLKFADGRMYWMDEYVTDFYERQA